MHKSITRMFPERDLQRIQDAVHAAESLTSGEIVPYVVARSDGYEEAEWRAAALLGSLTLVVAIWLHVATDLWLPFTLMESLAAVLAASLLGMLAVRWIPAAKRLLAGRHLLDRRVAQRAAEAFVSEEVFLTRDRTGILIFLSLLEHRVLVVGDSGINAKVQKGQWDDIVRAIGAGIAAGKPADGLVEGIAMSGRLLQQHGVSRKPDDRDELPDTLRMSDR